MDRNSTNQNYNADTYYNVWGISEDAASNLPLLPNTVNPTSGQNSSYFPTSLHAGNSHPMMGGDWELGFHTLQINEREAQVFPSTLLNYKPEFRTLVPPLHFGYDEVHWMHPTRKIFHELRLDPMQHEAPVQDEAKTKYESECQLFNTSIEEPLAFALRQSFIRDIETHPDMVNHFGLTPSNLPGIVTNNQYLAIAILLALMKQKRDISELLDVLVEMEVSVNTMEVVNRLANDLQASPEGGALPRPFLHQYISNCIVHCMKLAPTQLQYRQVRLVCVFLLSLFRNHVIEIQLLPQALLFELESFCVEFGRLREATSLFTHIKELESAEIGTEAAISKAFDTLEDEDKGQDENKNEATGGGVAGVDTSTRFNKPIISSNEINTKLEP